MIFLYNVIQIIWDLYDYTHSMGNEIEALSVIQFTQIDPEMLVVKYRYNPMYSLSEKWIR